MKDLDPLVFVAVLQEMMGPLLWVLIALAVLVLAGFLFLLLREKRLVSGRLVKAEVVGVAGGFLALAIMAWVTLSGFTDAGGPIDWLVIVAVWGVGAVGTAVLAYTVFGLWPAGNTSR